MAQERAFGWGVRDWQHGRHDGESFAKSYDVWLASFANSFPLSKYKLRGSN
jgi:hypothetical protein